MYMTLVKKLNTFAKPLFKNHTFIIPVVITIIIINIIITIKILEMKLLLLVLLISY